MTPTPSLRSWMVVAGFAALAAGVAAGLWLDTADWRLAVAAAALAVLAGERWWRRHSPARTTALLACLALASLAQATAVDLWRFVTTPEVRVWNVFHYYLGAKYFAELGYHDLYTAVLRADREQHDYWHDIDRVRNLATNQREPRDVAAQRYRPEEHFSEPRWRALQRDVAALQTQLPARQWRNVFTDRGYNPSPLWTAVGKTLATVFPADRLLALKVLTALDPLLLLLTFWLIHRTFGLRAAALVLLFFTLTPVNDNRLVGGFLQYDWFCALTAGFCLLRRRPWLAGWLVSYAVATRIFPLVFVGSAALPLLVGWVRRGWLPRRTLKFFAAVTLGGALGFTLGCAGGGGMAAWTSFADNLRTHADEHVFGERRVGWKHVFTHDVSSFDLDLSSRERRAFYAEQEALYVSTAAVLLLLYGATVIRRRAPDAFLLGLVPLFVLVVSSRYYWAYLALLPLLVGLTAPARRRLAAGQASAYAGFYLYQLTVTTDHYARYSVLNLLLALFLTGLLASFLAHDLLRRRRGRG